MSNDQIREKVFAAIRWFIKKLLGNAVILICVSTGVFVIAFFKPIIRHIENGGFIESLLWLVGAFAGLFIIGTLILLGIKWLLEKPGDASPAASGSSSTQNESLTRPPLFKTGKVTELLVFLSIGALIGIGVGRWRQYIYEHRMRATAPRCMLTMLQDDPSSCLIAVMVYVTNGGPDSKPFGWKLRIKLPVGNVFEGQPADWSRITLPRGASNAYYSNNIIDALSKETLLHGAEKTGPAIFYMFGVPPLQIPFGTDFIVQFEDGQGHKVEAKTGWNGPVQQIQ